MDGERQPLAQNRVVWRRHPRRRRCLQRLCSKRRRPAHQPHRWRRRRIRVARLADRVHQARQAARRFCSFTAFMPRRGRTSGTTTSTLSRKRTPSTRSTCSDSAGPIVRRFATRRALHLAHLRFRHQVIDEPCVLVATSLSGAYAIVLGCARSSNDFPQSRSSRQPGSCD